MNASILPLSFCMSSMQPVAHFQYRLVPRLFIWFDLWYDVFTYFRSCFLDDMDIFSYFSFPFWLWSSSRTHCFTFFTILTALHLAIINFSFPRSPTAPPLRLSFVSLSVSLPLDKKALEYFGLRFHSVHSVDFEQHKQLRLIDTALPLAPKAER